MRVSSEIARRFWPPGALDRDAPGLADLQGNPTPRIARARYRKPPLQRDGRAIDLQIGARIVGVEADDECAAIGAMIVPERGVLRQNRRQAGDKRDNCRAENNIPVPMHVPPPEERSIDQRGTALPITLNVISLPHQMA